MGGVGATTDVTGGGETTQPSTLAKQRLPITQFIEAREALANKVDELADRSNALLDVIRATEFAEGRGEENAQAKAELEVVRAEQEAVDKQLDALELETTPKTTTPATTAEETTVAPIVEPERQTTTGKPRGKPKTLLTPEQIAATCVNVGTV